MSCQKLPFATEEEIKNIVLAAKNSTCELDSLPTSLLKNCVDPLLSSITKIMNLSLTTGTVPTHLKHAVVRPLLKKSNLDKETFKNYRPVSNHPFLSKVLEKLVPKRLLKHMNDHNLHEVMQSAYKRAHSTETVLVKVQNDILVNLDQNTWCDISTPRSKCCF